jgi:hypothetical protein
MKKKDKGKVGADDFIASGAKEDDLQALPRVVLYQEIKLVDEDYVVLTPAHHIECRFSALHITGRGIDAELTVTHEGTGLHWGQLLLGSTTAREALVKKLASIAGLQKVPWRTILERACYATAQEIRKPGPVTALRPTQRTGPRHAIWPVVEAEGSSVIYSDGGSGKGLLALTLAIVGVTGRSLVGLQPTAPRPVLYLDWESSQPDLEHRLFLLGQGLGVNVAGLITYRRMVRPLAEEVDLVRHDIARLPVAPILIVDSLVPATGSEPEGADSALRFWGAVRSVGAPTLVIAHISGASTQMKGGTRPFGSVYKWNLPRSCWELKRNTETAPHVVQVGLYHRKINEGVFQAPFGLTFTFDPPGDDATCCAVHLEGLVDLGKVTDLAGKLPLTERILAMLATGALTTREIADATGAKVAVARVRLNDLRRKRRVVKLKEGDSGQDSATWGLPTRDEPR